MIGPFTGQYFFLSNFHRSYVAYQNRSYPTVEHAFQAAKTDDTAIRSKIRAMATPGEAKRYGRKIKMSMSVEDWNEKRTEIMEEILISKFKDPLLAKKLLATGEEELVEVNTWGDRFWGVHNGRGENYLGKLLMRIRNGLSRKLMKE